MLSRCVPTTRIIILQSGDIFRNLAFEACLYGDKERFSLQNHSTHLIPPTDILLWRSNPCVVIGRFQCAWKECNMDRLRSQGWPLARRQSGGGAVFHDRGNMNISFIQPRSVLDRRKCMEFLQTVLQSSEHNVVVGERNDLWLSRDQQNQVKISGSASRLGSHVAYHHCTLLCESDLSKLHSVLSPTFISIKSQATDSVRSPVVNLNLGVQLVEKTIVEGAMRWLSEPPNSPEPVVVHLAEGDEHLYVNSDRFEQVTRELRSWTWIMGSSPAFEFDLAEFEPKLHQIGQFMLHTNRGAKVKHLDYTPLNPETSQQVGPFVTRLSDILTGTECSPNGWYGLLDGVSAQWQFDHGDEDLWIPLIVKALRIACDRF